MPTVSIVACPACGTRNRISGATSGTARCAKCKQEFPKAGAFSAYPTGAAYREALFSTTRCFDDPILRGGEPLLDLQGMPKAISGNFATVFTVTGVDGRKWGVKCFTRHVGDQRVRYGRISSCLAEVRSAWRVSFDYVPRGILCNGQWYPILRMEWIEANALIPFVESHLWQAGALAQLAKEFGNIARELSELGIAHGDLQHGNLLVTKAGGLKLVDYDGMYVPGLDQLGASELGHPNYQSPARTTASWGPELDRFSAWLIYCSLVALTIEPTLWGWLHRDGEEALIFTKKDFLAPGQSVALRSLTQSPDQRLQTLGRALLPLVGLGIEALPPFDSSVLPAPSEDALGVLSEPTSKTVNPATDSAAKAISDWLASLDRTSAYATSTDSNDPSWILDHLPALEPVRLCSSSVSLIRSVVGGAVVGVGTLVALMGAGKLSAPFFVLGVMLIVLLAAICPLLAFARTPESREKRIVQANVRRLRADADRARKAVARSEAERRAVDRLERDALDKLSKLARKATDGEHADIRKIDTDLTNSLRRFDRALQGLTQAEDRERGAALRDMQRDHMTESLTRATVASAHLPGIGSDLRLTLRAHNISSAADFTGISYVGSQVFINLRSGQHVHPMGIGNVKAQTLEAWRRSVVAAAQARQPSILPADRSRAIEFKYVEQRMTLEHSTYVAKAEAAKSQKLTRQRWAMSQANISTQIDQLRTDVVQRRADADLALIGARRELNNATWQEALGKHRLTVYKGVTYGEYFTRGLRG